MKLFIDLGVVAIKLDERPGTIGETLEQDRLIRGNT